MIQRKIHVGIHHILPPDDVRLYCNVNPGNPLAGDQPPFVMLYVGPADFVLTARKARDLRDTLTRALESPEGMRLLEMEEEAENSPEDA